MRWEGVRSLAGSGVRGGGGGPAQGEARGREGGGWIRGTFEGLIHRTYQVGVERRHPQ